MERSSQQQHLCCRAVLDVRSKTPGGMTAVAPVAAADPSQAGQLSSAVGAEQLWRLLTRRHVSSSHPAPPWPPTCAGRGVQVLRGDPGGPRAQGHPQGAPGQWAEGPRGGSARLWAAPGFCSEQRIARPAHGHRAACKGQPPLRSLPLRRRPAAATVILSWAAESSHSTDSRGGQCITSTGLLGAIGGQQAVQGVCQRETATEQPHLPAAVLSS